MGIKALYLPTPYPPKVLMIISSTLIPNPYPKIISRNWASRLWPMEVGRGNVVWQGLAFQATGSALGFGISVVGFRDFLGNSH